MSDFNWKQTFFRNWNLMRVIRLFFAIVILYEAFQTHEIFYGIAGGLFLVQTVFNWGCCGTNGCRTYVVRNNSKSITEDIKYEEVKGEN